MRSSIVRAAGCLDFGVVQALRVFGVMDSGAERRL